MNILHLKRSYLDNGCFGKLFHNGELFCYTVERPWLNNKPDISCIPAGLYDLFKHKSPSKGTVYALVNPDLGVTLHGPSQRTHCYFHAANFVKELHGCIGPGMSLHPDVWGVGSSRKAMEALIELLGSGDFRVLIE